MIGTVAMEARLNDIVVTTPAQEIPDIIDASGKRGAAQSAQK
jgi:hypothetical protein